MEIIDPKIVNKDKSYSPMRELPLKSDETTAKRFVEDNNLGTFDSFTSNEYVRFSNHGGIAYNYFVSGVTGETYWGNTGITYEWRTEYGHSPTISKITYS